MKIFHTIESVKEASFENIALTIGYFDGVHLGHSAVLKRLKQIPAHTVVLTFSNHPGELLHQKSITHLTTLSHRMTLLQKMGMEATILIPFTESLSCMTASTFLAELKQQLPISHLVLGHDAVIGSDRQKNLFEVARDLQFSLEYLQPVSLQGTTISSSAIRTCISSGKLQEASQFLGRPYSIFATVQTGHGKGRELGFHTANLPVDHLALPPLGVYVAQVNIQGQTYRAVANLGHAPTLHEKRPICLEVHVLDSNLNLYGQDLEVIPIKYLRPEKRFDTLESLKLQIKQDILQAELICF